MKNSRCHSLIILAMLFTALAAPSTSGQMKTVGEVVEVVGKTVIVAVPAGRITIELQYVDVPEPDQALYSVVKDHVNSLLLGKTVEVDTRGFTRGKISGKLILNGVDVCLQLLRDGAVWHLPIEISGQPRNEFDLYAGSEALARQEERGVWSVQGLKSPWQIRAEAEEKNRQANALARRGKTVPVGVSRFQTDNRRNSITPTSASPSRRSQMDAWVNVFAFTGNEPHGIQTYKDPQGRYEVVYTSPSIIDFSSASGKEKLECRGLYVTVNSNGGSQTNFHLIAFRAITDDYRFSKTKTRMTALVDDQTLSLGSPFGFRGQGLIGSGGIGSVELMYFRTSGAVLKKIGNAKTVEFSINDLSASLPADTRDLLWQLSAATR